MREVARRKLEHLDICATHDVESRGTTLLEEVHLFHEALPEMAWSEVDPSIVLLGRRLQAPLLIGGMTGGAPRARDINLALAEAAQKLGLGLGLGSQRAMLLDPACTDSYRVRPVAPDVLLLGNLGAVQAREAGVGRVAEAVAAVGADALCVHFNVAQELVQDDGDRDFRGALETLEALACALPVPVVAKETGCGFAPGTLARVASAGVAAVDVSGRGGTTWTGVEAERGSTRQRALGRVLREWGVPTAAAVIFARRAGLCAIASGGIRTPVDAVRAIALGADSVAMALPFLRAFAEAGADGVRAAAEGFCEGIRALMLLVGARTVPDLHHAPRVLGPSLRGWLQERCAAAPAGRTPGDGAED